MSHLEADRFRRLVSQVRPQVSNESLDKSESTASSEISAQGTRRCERYRCGVTVQVREAIDDFPATCEVVDISKNGCYAPNRSPFPKGTTLLMTLWIDGKRCDLIGVVRTCDPALGNGIEFVTMEEKDRKRLRDHLASLPLPDDEMSNFIR